MGRGYIAVEGRGEVGAVVNLVSRLWDDLGLPFSTWATPFVSRALHTAGGIQGVTRLIRNRGDADRLLILRDADLKTLPHGDCPKHSGPAMAAVVTAERLPFPTATVLLHREYETLFLPCVHLMAGRALFDPRLKKEVLGLLAGTAYTGDYEAIRGVKEWLSKNMPPGRAYRPATDQLALTRLLDFPTLRQSGLPCFGTLERALQFLGDPTPGPGRVYPSEAS